ncbi:unnamed protein product [Scytosiphon promiscuus]
MGSAFSGIAEFFTTSAQQLPTDDFDGTQAIGLSFIFLAYLLHPAIISSYHRVRAYRAWRAIEKRQAVEVTSHSDLSEMFGGRGKWDAPRFIAIALLVFNLASWGLELSMDLYSLDGEAYLLTQPPPVFRVPNGNGSSWHVLSLDDINGEEGKFDGTWESLAGENVYPTEAKSRYYVTNFKKYAWSKEISTFINGEIVVASWTGEGGDIPEKLSYVKNDTLIEDEGSGAAVLVESVGCSSNGDEVPVTHTVNGRDEEWGRALECENGPRVVGSDAGTSQPAIILARDGGAADTGPDTHIIVEEASTHPSFLYSVWTADGVDFGEGPVAINFAFHIASTVRLADAVVTGIVNGYTDGAGCFGLLRAYSRGPNPLEFPKYNGLKANPFGENPEGGFVDSLQDVETIEAGMEVNRIAMICFVCLMVLSFIGISWSLLLRKKTGMDIYDRDELIRAISLQAQGPTSDLTGADSAIRLFVRKEDNGSMSVVVTDAADEDDRSGCGRLLRRRKKVVETDEPEPVVTTDAQYNDGFGGAAVPVGPRTMWLGGMRTGMSRSFPGRSGNFQYPTSVALTASPVPSDAGSFAGTPVAGRSPLWRHQELAASPAQARDGRDRIPSFLPEGRGASALFDSVRSVNSSHSGSGQSDTGNGARGSRGNDDGGGGDFSGGRSLAAFGAGRGPAPPVYFDGGASRGTGVANDRSGRDDPESARDEGLDDFFARRTNA